MRYNSSNKNFIIYSQTHRHTFHVPHQYISGDGADCPIRAKKSDFVGRRESQSFAILRHSNLVHKKLYNREKQSLQEVLIRIVKKRLNPDDLIEELLDEAWKRLN